MNLKGRRQSTNVDDRRSQGSTGSKLAIGGGIGGVVIAVLLALLNGGDIFSALQNTAGTSTAQGEPYTPSAEEEELAVFAKQVFASTEDVWTAEFKKILCRLILRKNSRRNIKIWGNLPCLS